MENVTFIIQTHELGYVMDYLMNEYFKTCNPFKKKKLKKIMNEFHRYMFPKFKKDLIEWLKRENKVWEDY